MSAESAPAGMAVDIARNRQWAERAFSPRAAAPQPVNRLVIIHEDVAGDTKLGHCAAVNAPPMRLGDRVYTHGIGVNSHSEVRVSLTKPAARFRATIGIDRNMDNSPASVRFHVQVAGKDLFVTDVIRAGAAPRDIDVPLDGATEFELIVDDGGDGRNSDQSDWADARVTYADGSEQFVDDLARQAQLGEGLPFSFVYGGKPSSEFLATWTRTDKDEPAGPGEQRKTVTLTDPQTKLQVQAICTTYTDTPGVDWTLHFTNTGEQDTPIIEQVRALDAAVTLGIGNAVVLHRLNGSVCATDDWLPFDQTVAPGQRVEMNTSGGRSSSISPFWTLDWGGEGIITAVGWSGQWSASVELKDGQLRTQAGMQNFHTVLHPGETIRGPRIMQLHWSGGDQYRAGNLFRQTMLAHIVPQANGKAVPPPIIHLSTSFYELNASNEENVLSHLHAMPGLGFELFWLDAYWTGPKGFPESMGNYGLPLESVEPPDRFPHGLKHIGDEVKKAGFGFLMWFEPERVAAGTRIAREHPEWVLSPGGDGSGLLNLGLPAAREALTAYLDAAIKQYQLSWLRIDYNIDPLGFWQFMDAKDPKRVGMTETRYVEGLYRMWDDLRAANPGLLIDNCASGGRRIDLEACSRSIPLWRSDNTCDMVGDDPNTILMAAVKNQLMSAGLNRYLPYSTVGQMGPEPYSFRSGFNGGIDFAQDIRSAKYPRELLRKGIAEGKRLRKYWTGDFYPLSEVTTDIRAWCVMQYHRPTEGDGIVTAFRRHASPYSGYDCHLREINPHATYQVTMYHDYEPEKPVTMRGADLEHLSLAIGICPGSVLVEYKKVK